jgi:hypothetical protein
MGRERGTIPAEMAKGADLWGFRVELAEREGLAPEWSMKPFQTTLSFDFRGS